MLYYRNINFSNWTFDHISVCDLLKVISVWWRASFGKEHYKCLQTVKLKLGLQTPRGCRYQGKRKHQTVFRLTYVDGLQFKLSSLNELLSCSDVPNLFHKRPRGSISRNWLGYLTDWIQHVLAGRWLKSSLFSAGNDLAQRRLDQDHVRRREAIFLCPFSVLSSPLTLWVSLLQSPTSQSLWIIFSGR